MPQIFQIRSYSMPPDNCIFFHSLLFPLTVTLTILYCPIGCPDSWVDWFASCYNRFLLRKTYKDALEYCQTFQATLVNINSNEENTFVHNTFVKNMEYRQAYIGVVRAEPGKDTFVTSEGKLQKYFNWARGEPNDFLGENCVEMRRGDEWNDIQCSTKYPFICEFSRECIK